jgi:hypothetical protein
MPFDKITRKQRTPGGLPSAVTLIRPGSRQGDKYAKMSNAVDADINRKASARMGETLSSTAKTKAAANEIAADNVVNDIEHQHWDDERSKYGK